MSVSDSTSSGQTLSFKLGINAPVKPPQSRSRKSGVLVKGMLCGVAMMRQVCSARCRSLLTKASMGVSLSSRASFSACATPVSFSSPGV